LDAVTTAVKFTGIPGITTKVPSCTVIPGWSALREMLRLTPLELLELELDELLELELPQLEFPLEPLPEAAPKLPDESLDPELLESELVLAPAVAPESDDAELALVLEESEAPDEPRGPEEPEDADEPKLELEVELSLDEEPLLPLEEEELWEPEDEPLDPLVEEEEPVVVGGVP
jgi:hypothetical protein